MKRGFLQLSFLLVIIILTQSSLFATGGETKGKYTARTDADQAASYFYNLRANQKTGLIDPVLAAKVSEQVKATVGSRADLSWVELGPNNFAGQVNAIIVDNQTVSGRTLFAGTLGGGIYKSTDEAITWTRVSENMMVSDMIQTPDGTIYVATGLGLNSQSYNGLSAISYSSGLIGQGLFKSIDGGNTFLQIESTVPAINDDNAATWAYINELALTSNGTLLVATGGGLMVSTNDGETWSKAKDIDSNELDGNVINIKAASDGTLIASVDGKFYISTSGNVNEFENRSTGGANMLPTETISAHLIIAVAPTDPNIMYAVSIGSTGTHYSIYLSKNKGNSWRVILPSSTTIRPYDGDGLNYNKIIVDPNDAEKITLCARELWTAKSMDTIGFYSWEVRSISSYSPYSSLYMHPGVHSLTYSATSNNKFYLGTEGGVFRATIAADNYSFAQCNINLISGRFWNVGVSHKLNRVIGGSVDNGTIFILGSMTENNLQYGKKIQVGLDDFVGGQCAISAIDPDVFIITAEGNIVRRTNTMGTELSSNFSESLLTTGSSNTSFKTPIVLWESDKDLRSYDSVWFKSGDTLVAGDKIQVISNNAGYPFDYLLTEDLYPEDSILVQDIISSKLFIAIQDYLYVTREILQFDKEPVIFNISARSQAGISGTPQSLAVSADADHAFVGTTDGKLYRVSNIVDAYVDSLATAGNAACIITTTEIMLNTPAGVNSRAITSISVDQEDANKVIITLANYGNETYVYYSTNALSENPIFIQKQGNLPLMPVYASLIEMSNTNVVVLGTEHGIYMTDEITIENPVWYKSQNVMEDVPVFDLKQQTFEKGWAKITMPPAAAGEDSVVYSFQGVDNYGSIYAATYGRGLFRCDEYRIVGIDENPGDVLSGSATKLPMSLYPNPVSNQTRVAFEVIGNTAQINCHVYDLSGRIVYSEMLGQFANGKHEIQLPLSNLNSGAYILYVQDGQRSNACKFIVY